jgi:nucleotide-binding universal stress UspA family protein
MFKHILLPTDGSRHAEQAVLYGVELARVTGARVTGFRAAELEESSKQFAIDVQAHAERYLAFIASVANEAKVSCNTVVERNDHPHDAICSAAKRLQCDLIVMASHGRRGLVGLMLGSETQRALAHTDVPILVWRAPSD